MTRTLIAGLMLIGGLASCSTSDMYTACGRTFELVEFIPLSEFIAAANEKRQPVPTSYTVNGGGIAATFTTREAAEADVRAKMAAERAEYCSPREPMKQTGRLAPQEMRYVTGGVLVTALVASIGASSGSTH